MKRAPARPFRFGGREFLVVSFSIDDREPIVGLGRAERDVARRLLRGLSNAEIARERGTSVRTVQKQVAAIFRKLGVGSRAELVARLTRGS